jgi:hypothetical protein
LLLSDPYFYEAQQSVSLSTGTQNVTVAGDDNTRNILVTINGSRADAKIRNNTLGMEFEYDASIASGGNVSVDVLNFTSTTTPPSGPAFRSTGEIIHSGSTYWLELAPGTNSITLSSTSGSGTVTLAWKAAWI